MQPPLESSLAAPASWAGTSVKFNYITLVLYRLALLDIDRVDGGPNSFGLTTPGRLIIQ